MSFFSSSVDFSGRWKPHIWGFSGLAFVMLLLMAGCGLPNYVAIEKPVLLTDSYTTDSATVVGFTTPSDDENIVGYAVYYKIYSPDSYSNESESDKSALDENSYINITDEMPNGSTIPDKQGFFHAGQVGENTFGEYVIPHEMLGPGADVYLDFDPDGIGAAASDSNLRLQPIIGFGGTPVVGGTIMVTLARGFIDYSDDSLYDGDVGSSGNPLYRCTINSGDTFRLFTSNDWDFVAVGDTDAFTDGDLRNGSYSMQYQPGTIENDILSVGDPLSLSSPGTLHIALAVSSVGKDITGGTFVRLDSKPIYIGEILNYTPLYGAVRQYTTR